MNKIFHSKFSKPIVGFVISTVVATQLLITGVFIFPGTVLAATSGPLNAGTGADVTGVGSITWSSPENITSDDLSYASVVLNQNNISHYLQGTNYGFSIPTDATINGITVDINRYSSGTSSLRVRDYHVYLVKGGTIQTITDKAATTTNWSTNSPAVATYGGTADLWGNTWTPTDINSSNFGAVISATNTNSSSRTGYIDYIQVTITYTLPPHTITSSANVGGAISPSGAVSVNDGASQTFTITPSATYIVSDILVDATSQGKLNSYTFNNVIDDHSITASFDGGWNAPNASANNNSVTTPDNAFTSNNSYAVFNNQNDQVDYTTFGLSIPVGATVNGIELAFEANRPDPRTVNFSLSSNETTWTTGSGVKNSGSVASTDTTYILGSSTDLWNRVWTPADFSNFRVRVDAQSSGSGDIFNLDQLQVKIYYTPDTTLPVVTINPPSQTLEAAGPTGAVANFTVTAIDNIDGDISGSAICDKISGSVFPLGDTTITCTATDAAGNTGTGTATVTVQDTTAPIISLLGTPTVSLVVNDPYIDAGATASDIVDGNLTGNIVTVNPVNTLIPNIYTVTYNVSDNAGNAAGQVTRTVTVSDVNAPVINTQSDITLEAAGPTGAVATYPDATATDDVDGIIPASCTPISGSLFPIGNTPVACTATDSSGNIGNGVALSVIVQDTTPPVVTVNPPSQTLEAAGPTGAVANFTVTAIDNIDGDISGSAICDKISGSVFPLGDTTITCTATDAAGNTGTGTATVTVQDTTAPVLNLPSDITTEATTSTGAIVNYTATSTDLVDPSPSLTCDPVSGSLFPLGANTVGCSTTDAAGNTASSTFMVTIQDTTPPNIDTNPDIIIEATDSTGAVVNFINPASTDLVDGVISSICLPVSGSIFLMGTSTVSCSATDNHSNTASSTFKVTVQDTMPPTKPVADPVGGDYNQSILVSLTSQDNNPDAIYYTLDGSEPNASSTLYNSQISITTDTTLKAIAYDKAGNVSEIMTETYNIAPIISNETSSNPQTTSFTTTWETNNLATSRVIYDTVSHATLGSAPNYGYANSTIEDSTLVASHSVMVSGLNASTTYYYRTVSHGSPESVGAEQSTATTPTTVTPSGGGGGGSGSFWSPPPAPPAPPTPPEQPVNEQLALAPAATPAPAAPQTNLPISVPSTGSSETTIGGETTGGGNTGGGTTPGQTPGEEIAPLLPTNVISPTPTPNGQANMATALNPNAQQSNLLANFSTILTLGTKNKTVGILFWTLIIAGAVALMTIKRKK